MEKWEHKMSVKVGGEKTEFTVIADMTGLNTDPFTARGLSDFAANQAKAVRDGNQTVADFVTGFQETVEKYSRGELKRVAGEKVARAQTPEQVATNNIAQALRARKNLKAKDALEMAKAAAGNPEHPGHKAWEKELARVKKLMETDVEGF